jgi:cyclase
MRPRVVPVLLVENGYLVKTKGFKKPTYVGDPINAVRIFNEKQADELFLLDIARNGGAIDFQFVEDVVNEAFMPVAVGGRIRSLDDARRLIDLGVEKVVMNRACFVDPSLISQISEQFGAQAVVASIDTETRRSGRQVVVDRSGQKTKHDPVGWAQELERRGAGEILLTETSREGQGRGYDLELIGRVAPAVSIPVVVNGGAGKTSDFAAAVEAGAAAVAAGTMFTFHGPNRAVLITYPADEELNTTFGTSNPNGEGGELNG